MHTAMWLIPIAPFILGIATTWSLREAFEETVWFNVAYVLTLGVIYLADAVGYGFISTSPVGSGGLIAMVTGFIALGVRRRQWKIEQREKAIAKARKAREQARLAAASGKPQQDNSMIVNAFRFAGSLERARRQSKRKASDQR
jgi:hypothetical protein